MTFREQINMCSRYPRQGHSFTTSRDTRRTSVIRPMRSGGGKVGERDVPNDGGLAQ